MSESRHPIEVLAADASARVGKLQESMTRELGEAVRDEVEQFAKSVTGLQWPRVELTDEPQPDQPYKERRKKLATEGFLVGYAEDTDELGQNVQKLTVLGMVGLQHWSIIHNPDAGPFYAMDRTDFWTPDDLSAEQAQYWATEGIQILKALSGEAEDDALSAQVAARQYHYEV